MIPCTWYVILLGTRGENGFRVCVTPGTMFEQRGDSRRITLCPFLFFVFHSPGDPDDHAVHVCGRNPLLLRLRLCGVCSGDHLHHRVRHAHLRRAGSVPGEYGFLHILPVQCLLLVVVAVSCGIGVGVVRGGDVGCCCCCCCWYWGFVFS